ncbi:hypothetical protein THAOC_30330 [Thalassiosira oceanica]|uniref:Uncharacterized protein n=1 Tax=Thalassiosira oceanica TaxID=159749 RepID=K0RVC5_THAOC|nr:hypothetical protein THAOC_30330 [Thalassiosira oceanica]|eukprot:EJK50637.1 hypothetical protein THAOC_30330 [Thalassiosira oceanica]
MVDLRRILLPASLLSSGVRSFSTPSLGIARPAPGGVVKVVTALRAKRGDDERKPGDKFSFGQRIESTKSAVIGLLAGGVAATPFTALHDLPLFGAAQWEFDTYCVREDDDNDMLSMGVMCPAVEISTVSGRHAARTARPPNRLDARPGKRKRTSADRRLRGGRTGNPTRTSSGERSTTKEPSFLPGGVGEKWSKNNGKGRTTESQEKTKDEGGAIGDQRKEGTPPTMTPLDAGVQPPTRGAAAASSGTLTRAVTACRCRCRCSSGAGRRQGAPPPPAAVRPCMSTELHLLPPHFSIATEDPSETATKMDFDFDSSDDEGKKMPAQRALVSVSKNAPSPKVQRNAQTTLQFGQSTLAKPTSNKANKPLSQLSKKEQVAKKKEIIAKKMNSNPSTGLTNKMLRIAKDIKANHQDYPQVNDEQIASIDLKAKWPLAKAFGFSIRGNDATPLFPRKNSWFGTLKYNGDDRGKNFNAQGQSLLDKQRGKNTTMIKSFGEACGEWGQESRGEIWDAAADSSVTEAQFLDNFRNKHVLLKSGAIKPGVAGIVLPANCDEFYSRILNRTARPENGKRRQSPEERVTSSLRNFCSSYIKVDAQGNQLARQQKRSRATHYIFMHEYLTPDTREQWVNGAKQESRAAKEAKARPAAKEAKAPPAAKKARLAVKAKAPPAAKKARRNVQYGGDDSDDSVSDYIDSD